MLNPNEYRIFDPTCNQHSNSYSLNPNINEISQMESNIYNMALPENKEGQNLPSGCGADNLPNFQNNQTNFTEGVNNTLNNINAIQSEEDNGYTFSYMEDKLKRNPEEMIDQITFSDDEEEPHKNARKKENISTEMLNSETRKICDFYEEDASMTKYTGTKNELDTRKEIPVPFQLTPSDVLLEAGIVDDLIDDRIIIKANSINGTLDLDNIMFTINKIAFGYIDDVIGKIDQPIYVVRNFPNVNISSLNLNHGQSIYNIKDKSKYVGQRQLHRKGCDASNAFDEEVSDDEMEFSDDEEEMTRRSELRKRKKSTNSNKNDSYKKRKVDEENCGDSTCITSNGSLAYSMNKLKEQYAYNNQNIGSNLSYNPKMYVENKINYQTGINTSNTNNVNMNNNNNTSNQFYSNEYRIPSNNISSINNQMNQNSSYPMNNFPYPGGNINTFNPYAQMNPMNPMSMYSQQFNQMNQINNPNNTFTNTSQPSLNGLNINFQSVNPFQPPNTQNHFK